MMYVLRIIIFIIMPLFFLYCLAMRSGHHYYNTIHSNLKCKSKYNILYVCIKIINVGAYARHTWKLPSQYQNNFHT